MPKLDAPSMGEPPEGLSTTSPQERDPVLVNLVILANGPAQLRMGLTVQIGGATVAGTLVGIEDWAHGWGEAFVTAFAEDAQEVMRGWIGGLIEGVKSVRKESPQESQTSPPRFLHLENARVHFAGQPPMPSDAGVWWRGRIADVNGWWLGRLTTPQDSDEQDSDESVTPKADEPKKRRRRPASPKSR